MQRAWKERALRWRNQLILFVSELEKVTLHSNIVFKINLKQFFRSKGHHPDNPRYLFSLLRGFIDAYNVKAAPK